MSAYPEPEITQDTNAHVPWHKSPVAPIIHHEYMNPEFHVAPAKKRMWKGLPTIVYTGIIVAMLTSSALLMQGNSVGDIRSRATTNVKPPTPTLIHRVSSTPTRTPTPLKRGM